MTLAEARERVRLRLEDTSSNPSWTDAAIEEGLRDSLERYAFWFPAEETIAVPVNAGATSIDLPAESSRVRRVTDPRGTVVPQRSLPLRATAADEQSWENWGSSLEFSRPLLDGDYQIRVATPRPFPESEHESLPVPEGDLLLIVLGAVVWCLKQRSIADWKRGPLPARYELVLRRAKADYDDAWQARTRQVRSGRLLGTG